MRQPAGSWPGCWLRRRPLLAPSLPDGGQRLGCSHLIGQCDVVCFFRASLGRGACGSLFVLFAVASCVIAAFSAGSTNPERRLVLSVGIDVYDNLPALEQFKKAVNAGSYRPRARASPLFRLRLILTAHCGGPR
jgi:hypothetical protein